MLRGRVVPVAAAAVLGAGLWWQTAGGRNQPKGHAERGGVPVSEALQSAAGSGGARARAPGDMNYEAKDTRIYSRSPDADSKRDAGKGRGKPGSGEVA